MHFKVGGQGPALAVAVVFVAIGAVMVVHPDVPITQHPSDSALVGIRLVGLAGGLFWAVILLLAVRWAVARTPMLDLSDPTELRVRSASLGIRRNIPWSEIVGFSCTWVSTAEAVEIQTVSSARPVRIYPKHIGTSCPDLVEELERAKACYAM